MTDSDIRNFLKERCVRKYFSCPNSLCGSQTENGCPQSAYINCLSNSNGQPAGPQI